MAASESVAKGCFPFKGKKKCARAEDYLPTDSSQAPHQYNIYEQMWANINNKFQELQLEVNDKVFEDLVLYIENSHQQFGRFLSVQEIPTAALITDDASFEFEALRGSFAVGVLEQESKWQGLA